MMRQFSYIFGLIIITALSFSCEKQDTNTDRVDLYIIDSYLTVDSTFEIDESSVICRAEPLISYEEIISYDKSDYTFKITDTAKDSIENFYTTTSHAVFAIKVNEELIYTGYFWPSFYSMTCQWVVIDPLMLDISNKLEVKLGYPSLFDGVEIPDKRNDSRILEVFKKDKKLKK